MLTTTARQTSLFYAAFGQQASLIKDDLLDEVDALLDDPILVNTVALAQVGSAPNARTMGRRRMAPDRVLRCYALKHIKNWSFRDLEREVRGSLVYRRFTRFDDAPIPDHATLSRNFCAVTPEVTQQVHARVVERARQDGIAQGRRLRVDTTVVETNIHHPTDSTLLQDGVRVLTRAAKRIAEACLPGEVDIVDHTRAVQRRVIEIHRASKAFTEASRDRLKEGYRKLVRIAGQVVRKVEQVDDDLRSGKVHPTGGITKLLMGCADIEHFVPLVKRVIAQTKARVFGGDNHVAGKLVSLFEEHTQVIRKGKAAKPAEFGRLVRIDEVENGIVTGYAVAKHNDSDATQWRPALEHHRETFGRAPRLATADRGFFSADNEKAAKDLGVRKVALPARGPLSSARAALQKQRWYRAALRWRGAIEPRIANLKHRFGMARAHYKGAAGFERYVGWSVIGQNLVAIARVRSRRRKAQQDAEHQTQRAA